MTDGEFADGHSCRHCEARYRIFPSKGCYAGRGNLPINKRKDRYTGTLIGIITIKLLFANF